MQEIEHSVNFVMDNFKRYTLLDRAKAVQVCVDCMFDAMSADNDFMVEIAFNGFKGFDFFEDDELLQEVATLDLMEDALEEGWVRFE
jgi:hypothetical protein